MFREAIEIIRKLFAGGYVTYHDDHFDVASVKLSDRPDKPPPIGVAGSGRPSCGIAGRQDAFVIATQPRADLTEIPDRDVSRGRRCRQARPRADTGVLGPDEAECRRLGREQFRRAAGGRCRLSCPSRSTSTLTLSSRGRRTSPSWTPAARAPTV